jgi:hypothetical protein
VAVLAAPLWAQTSRVYRDGNAWVEETTGTLPAGREFRATTDVGSLQVQGSANQVTYVVRKRTTADTEEAARKQFEQLKVTATKVGDAVVLEGRVMGRNMSHMAAEFAVQIPRLTQVVRAETRGGTLSLSSIQGAVMGTSSGGNVKLDDIGGAVKVLSAGGTMDAGNISADAFLQSGAGAISVERVTGQLMVRTGGGRVKIGSAGPTTIETGAGNIEVGRCAGDLHAETGGGNLNIGDVMGSMTAETGGGSVKLGSALGFVKVITGGGSVDLWKVGQGAHVETGTGAITVQFVGSRNQFHDSYLHTAQGNVVVYLPRDLGVSVHASTEMFSGQGIKSDFPGLAITSEGGQWGPKSMFAEGQLNGGGPVLRVRTTSGQIDIRRTQ